MSRPTSVLPSPAETFTALSCSSPLRQSSAGRRRRRCKQLTWRLHQIAPRVAVIRATPVVTATAGSAEVRYVVLALDEERQALRIAPGSTRRIVALLQMAHPQADWSQSVSWHAGDDFVVSLHPGGGGRPCWSR